MMLAWFSASADDHRTLRREDRDDAGVAGESGLEGEHRLDVLERGQPRLELLVERHRAGDRPHRAGARTVALDRLDRRRLEAGMGVEAQVVVARQGDHLAAVDDASALLLALHHPQAAIEALRPQVVERGVEEGERVARARRLHRSWEEDHLSSMPRGDQLEATLPVGEVEAMGDDGRARPARRIAAAPGCAPRCRTCAGRRCRADGSPAG